MGVVKEENAIFRMFNFDVNVNRYLRAGAGFLIPIFNGPTYFNWPIYRTFFLKKGAYSSLCPADAVSSGVNTALCPDQEIAIGTLSSTVTGIHFMFSLLAGIMADKLPPKLQALIALIIQLIGYLIMFGSSEAMPLYIIGVSLVGVGADMSFFPLFSLTQYFPNNRATMISICGTGRSVAFAIPMMKQILANYFAESISMSAVFIGVQSALTLVSIFLALIALPGKRVTDASSEALPESAEVSSSTKDRFVAQVKDLIKTAKSPFYLLMVPYAVNNILRPIFLGTIAGTLLSPKNATIFSMVGALQFIPCPLLGMAVDKFSVFPVIQLLNTFGMLSVVTLLLDQTQGPSDFLQMGFIFSHNMAMSFVMSQVYCYGNIVFPANHVGKLIGSISTISGMAVLFGVPAVLTLAVKVGYVPVFSGLIISSVIAGLIGLYLWVLTSKQQKKKFIS